MTTVVKWSGDGLDAGNFTPSSVGDDDTVPTSVVGDGLSVVSTGPRPSQIQVTPPAGGSETYISWSFPPQIQGSGRFYWTSPSSLPVSGQIPYFFEVYSGTNRLWSIDFTSTGRFNLRSNTSVIQQGAAGMVATSTRYRIEWMFDNTTNSVSVSIFQGEGTTAYQTLGGTATSAASHNLVRIGRMNGGASGSYQFDDMEITDILSMPGPWKPPAPETSVFRFDGSSWIPVEPIIVS